MKKGQEYIGTVEKIDFPNKGVICYREQIEGKNVTTKVFVKDALPGQEVRFVLTKKRSSKCEGRIVEVIRESALADRIPPCEKFGECGGCTYQSVSYEKQLELKKEMVTQILSGVVSDPGLEGIIGSPVEFGYRNKMEYSFGDECKGGELALGLHKKGSFYDIVTADGCRIVHDDYNQIVANTLDYFKKREIPYYHKMTKEGYLRHLLIRRAAKTNEILVALVTTSRPEMDLTDYCDRLLGLPLEGRIAGVIHVINDGLADMVRSDRTEILYGNDYIYEEILGLRFKISVFSFFQTNTLG